MSHLRQSRKCDRACRTLRHGASHSRAIRFRNRALLYTMRLWRASKSRVKDARQNRRCDIGLTGPTSHQSSRSHTLNVSRILANYSAQSCMNSMMSLLVVLFVMARRH